MKTTAWSQAAALLAYAAAVTVAAGTENIIDMNFNSAPKPELAPAGENNPRVTGLLPKNWMDDTAWAQVWINYSVGEEQGFKFLRMNVERVVDGRPQLARYPVPDITEERTFRLTMTLRNLTGAPITFGLRMRSSPYTFYWSRSEQFSRDWQTESFEFRMAPNSQSMGLWINPAAGTGIVDIAAIKLQSFSDADLREDIRTKYPDQGPENLLRNTRFPLGLQNGWAIDRDSSDGDVVTVGPAGDTETPSGYTALRLDAPEPTVLRSSPFPVVYPITEHTLTFAARGNGEWTVSVFHKTRTTGSKAINLTAGADWQRFRVPFEPTIGIPFYQYQIAGQGQIVLDALQAGPAGKVAGYSPPGDHEAALALPDSDAARARIQFADEPALVTCCVTGRPVPVVVKTRLFDLYGSKTALPDVPLTPSKKGITGTLDIEGAIAAKPLGSFRIEAWTEKDGNRTSPINELVFHRVMRPRYWGKDAPNSPFGVHTNSTTRHNTMAKAVGINWTRLHDAGLPYIGWWNLEPKKGEWRFFDREIKRYRTHNINIFAELGTAPAWASYYQDSGRKSFGYFDKFFQPKNLEEYANYVRRVVSRYHGVIDAFDVWNEPWIHAWWGVDYDHEKGGRAGYITSKEPQKDFVAMMRVARNTAKAIQPDCKVFGFNTTTGKGNSETRFGGDAWTAGVLEHGGLQACDGIAYHGYTGGGVGYPGDSVERGLAVALGPIREKEGTVPLPVWMTEGSPLTHRMGNGIYKHTVPGYRGDASWDAADRIARYIVSMLANNVRKIFLYSMHSHSVFRTEPKQWNALTTDEGYLHPCGAAHAHAAWLLEDADFLERLDLGGNVFAYLFRAPTHSVAAISSAPDFESGPIPRSSTCTVTDLFGNPVPPEQPFSGRLIYVTSSEGPDRLRRVLTGARQ